MGKHDEIMPLDNNQTWKKVRKKVPLKICTARNSHLQGYTLESKPNYTIIEEAKHDQSHAVLHFFRVYPWR